MDPKASLGQRRYNLGVRILSTAVLPWASLSNTRWRSLLTETRRTLEDIRGLVVYVPQNLRFSTLFCFVLTQHKRSGNKNEVDYAGAGTGGLTVVLARTDVKEDKTDLCACLIYRCSVKKENLCLGFVHSATSSLQWVIQRDNDPKQQQISERLREKRIEVLRRSRPQPDWHAVLRELCTDKYCKPQWTYATLWRRVGQNPSTVTWEADKSHRKWLLQLIAGKSGSTPSSE